MTETLWAGEFGDAYTERNLDAHEGRAAFWNRLLSEYDIFNALEVGCNAGANLSHLSERIDVTGVDINQGALDLIPQHIPTWRVSASDLPFPDDSFDLTFTIGVLIHVPLVELHKVMSELVRTSRRYVLCGEYFSKDDEQRSYRGDVLWRRDYGRLYTDGFPELRLCDQGFLSGESWDDITWWLFEC